MKSKIHKACQNWGETVCGLPLFSAIYGIQTTEKWSRTTCSKCLRSIPKKMKTVFVVVNAYDADAKSVESIYSTKAKAKNHKGQRYCWKKEILEFQLDP